MKWSIINWHSTATIPPSDFVCWRCANQVGSNQGFHDIGNSHWIYICPRCNAPNIHLSGHPTHHAPYGVEVQHVPDDLNALYTEARKCISADAPTAATIACRKILLALAIEMNMEIVKATNFAVCVEWMFDDGHLPKTWKPWVDHIRTKGNEAAHELPKTTLEESKMLVEFVRMILQTHFEAPKNLQIPEGLANPQ